MGGSTNEKPRKKPARSGDRKIGLATFRPQFEPLQQLSLETGVLKGRLFLGSIYAFFNMETRFMMDFLIAVHSEGEEARKLEDLESSEAIFIRGKRILGGLTIAEQT